MSKTVLEERVHLLESQVATLTDALRVLARGLEDSPMSEPGDRTVVEAARRAHDLLLATRIPSSAQQDTGDRG
jgi:hypothetical protein